MHNNPTSNIQLLISQVEMRTIEEKAISDFGISSLILMENAGQAVVKSMQEAFDSLEGKKVCIFVGKGNNGGDGCVVARYLANLGAIVNVFVFASLDNISPDSNLGINLAIINKMKIDIQEVSNKRDWDKLKVSLLFADFLVDALIGTGFNGQLNDSLTQAIELINSSSKPIVAVDIPTGVNTNTGEIASIAIKADLTVTFAYPKMG